MWRATRCEVHSEELWGWRERGNNGRPNSNNSATSGAPEAVEVNNLVLWKSRDVALNSEEEPSACWAPAEDTRQVDQIFPSTFLQVTKCNCAFDHLFSCFLPVFTDVCLIYLMQGNIWVFFRLFCMSSLQKMQFCDKLVYFLEIVILSGGFEPFWPFCVSVTISFEF